MRQAIESKHYEPWLSAPRSSARASEAENKRELTHAAAIREALAQAMAFDERVFVMGQDVDAPTAMFGTTKDLHIEFGPDRCWDTPLAESALMGVAAGAAIGGRRPVYMHNRPDFLFLTSDQLINHAAKWHYMFGGKVSVPLVVWACIGRGWGSAAQHSQALQGFFLHTPGLKLVMPSTPYDAKGMMVSAIADPNPVLILEHRVNFRHTGYVPEEMYRIPFGKGITRRAGKDVTIIAISQMVAEALIAADLLADNNIDAEVIDLRSLKPLDETLIYESVCKTGRAVVADCGWLTGGITAEITALIAQHCFDALKAPPHRVACPNVPTPAGYTLEEAYYPGANEILRAAIAACEYVKQTDNS